MKVCDKEAGGISLLHELILLRGAASESLRITGLGDKIANEIKSYSSVLKLFLLAAF